MRLSGSVIVMAISAKNAQIIVNEIKSAVHHDLNIMDEQGIIIASTNSRRIGNLHKGAKKLLDSNESILIVEEDSDVDGTKQGVNLPIIIQGNCVGVIGITGNPQEVLILGTTIQKMTEIMLLSIQQQNEKNLQENAKFSLIESWLFSDVDSIQRIDFKLRATLLSIELSLPRIVCVLDYNEPVSFQEIQNNQDMKTAKLIQFFKKWVKQFGPDNICVSINERIVIIFAEDQIDNVYQRILCACADAQTFFGVEFFCGISEVVTDYTNVGEAYKHAVTACNTVKSTGSGKVAIFDSTSLFYLVQCLPKNLLSELEATVFGNYTPSEKAEMMETLHYFFNNDGNINKAAEAAYIHPNTFIYRLNTFTKKTGLNPRIPLDSSILSILWARHLLQKSHY